LLLCQHGCLLSVAVECAIARLRYVLAGLINGTCPSSNPGRAAILGQANSGTYAIELISWAVSEGSTVSSLICDRWLTRKLAIFMASTDPLQC